MIATIYPAGRECFDVELTSEPSWSDNARGGYGDATLACVIEPWMTDRLLDARVVIGGQPGGSYGGWVWAFGSSSISCAGHQSRLGMLARHALYAKTDFLQDLRYRDISLAPSANPAAFYANIAAGVVTVGMRNGTAVTTGNSGSYYYWGDVPLDHLDLTVYLNSGNVSAQVYTSDTRAAANTSVLTVTATGDTVTTVDLGGKYGFVLSVISDITGTTASDGYFGSFKALTLYGVDYATTPGNIIKDCLGHLPATDYPAGALGLIDSDESALAHLDVDGTEADVIAGVCEQTGRDFAFRMRDVGGIQWPVAIYHPRPTEPKYYVCHDGETVKADLRGATMDDMRSRIRGKYRGTDGQDYSVTVTDADNAHYLVKLGRVFDERLSVSSTDSTLVTAAITARLASRSSITNGGTVTVIGSQITDAYGVPVPPDKVEAGNLIAVSGTAFGEVVAYIDRAQHQGETAVTLTLDDSATIPVNLRRILGL